jgi:hypothetical protein
MAVWFWVLAFRVESKVLGKGVQKGALMGLHGLEAEAFLLWCRGEDAELALLFLGPFDILAEPLESEIGVRDMIVGVRAGVDVECLGELAVPLETETFVVAFERRLSVRRRVEPRRLAANLLFPVLARASNECLGLARLVLLAGVGCVALISACVLARFPDLATGLRAM